MKHALLHRQTHFKSLQDANIANTFLLTITPNCMDFPSVYILLSEYDVCV